MFYIKNIKIKSPAIIFILIAVWYAITNFIWWKLNTPNFPCYDMAALHFLEVFKNHTSHGPVIVWIYKFLLSVFGNGNLDKITVSVNYIFFLIPLYFIYKIGKEIDSEEAGNIAMILFALVPAVYGLSRQFGHKDYNIIAAMTVNIYCLIKTNNFRDQKWSILYGLSAGIGLLIKDSILIYLLPTFLSATVIALKEKFERRKAENILASLLFGLLMVEWIYFESQAIIKFFSDPVTLIVPIFYFGSLRATTFNVYEQLLSPPIFLIFLLGLFYFIKEYHNKNKATILLWIFVPWSIIFLMPHYKVPEYLTGLIPPIVLVCSIFLAHIKRNIIKKALMIFLIIIGVVQYINFSYYPLDLFSRIRIKISGIDFMYYDTATEHIMNFDVKNRSDKISKVVRRIQKEYPASNYAVYMDSKSAINNKVLRICMLLNGISCAITDIDKFNIRPEDEVIIIGGKFLPAPSMYRPEEKIMRKHPMFNEMLKDKGTSGVQSLTEYDEQLNKQLKNMDENFDLAEIFYFNDIIDENNKIAIYKRKNQ